MRTRVLLAGLVSVAALASACEAQQDDAPPAAQDALGPVLLVPGYGGGTGGLDALAARLEQTGRETRVIDLPGDGRGDLREAAQAVEDAAEELLEDGAPSIDVVGYSAGGVTARLFVREHADDVRRVVTLGAPHHGTRLAALGLALSPAECPVACAQLAPGSDLLDDLNAGDETPDGPQWLSLWTVQDETVTPPETASLDGAVNLALQDLCPGLQVSHGQLPVTPVVRALVLQALSAQDVALPSACPTS